MRAERQAKAFFKQHKARALTPYQYSTKDQSFECLVCLDMFDMSYDHAKALAKRWKRKDRENLDGVCCPSCRKSWAQSRTLASQYAAMTDEQLIKLSEAAYESNTEASNPRPYCDTPHYNEMRRRKNEQGLSLVDQVNELLGRRRQRPELDNYTLDDWRGYLAERKYINQNAWKRADSHGLKKCRESGYFEQLKVEFFSNRLLFLSKNGGIFHCQSNEEKIFAQVLDALDLEFEAHPEWPFCLPNSSRNCLADFKAKVNGRVCFIEVWLVGKHLLKPSELNDTFLMKYTERRALKERLIKQATGVCFDNFISIEARTLKNHGLETFLEEIKSVLHALGVNGLEIISSKLISEADQALCAASSLDSEWLLNYAIKNNLTHYTHFESSLERAIRRNQELKCELELKLAEYWEREPTSRFIEKSNLDDVKKFIAQRVDINTREAYEKAHQRGELPAGFLQNPVQYYDELTCWRELFGRPSLVDYDEARAIVRRLEVKGKTDFTQRRASIKESLDCNDPDYDLLKVKGNPGNPKSGGYQEFTTWSDFTSNVESIERNERNARNAGLLELVKRGALSEIVQALKSFKCESATALRKEVGNKVMDALLELNTLPFIELALFGNTRKNIKDLSAIAALVPEAALKNIDTWGRYRKANPEFQVFPYHIERELSGRQEGTWTEVIRILDTKRATFPLVSEWIQEGLTFVRSRL